MENFSFLALQEPFWFLVLIASMGFFSAQLIWNIDKIGKYIRFPFLLISVMLLAPMLWVENMHNSLRVLFAYFFLEAIGVAVYVLITFVYIKLWDK